MNEETKVKIHLIVIYGGLIIYGLILVKLLTPPKLQEVQRVSNENCVTFSLRTGECELLNGSSSVTLSKPHFENPPKETKI